MILLFVVSGRFLTAWAEINGIFKAPNTKYILRQRNAKRACFHSRFYIICFWFKTPCIMISSALFLLYFFCCCWCCWFLFRGIKPLRKDTFADLQLRQKVSTIIKPYRVTCNLSTSWIVHHHHHCSVLRVENWAYRLSAFRLSYPLQLMPPLP